MITHAPIQTTGVCTYCQAACTRVAMLDHLKNCPQRLARLANKMSGKPQAAEDPSWYPARLFHLMVYSSFAPDTYWLHLEAPATNSLIKLDSFFREVWLECCGHLSDFQIGDQIYARYPDQEFGRDEKSMQGKKLEKLLQVGDEFHYEYDYGTTTELTLAIVDEWQGEVMGKRPEFLIMAHNYWPQIPCDKCGRTPATAICVECNGGDWGKGWLCETHARSHPHEDMLLPALNSPRVGLCGYDGQYTRPAQFWTRAAP
jgi:hypothetical protein